MVTETKTQSAVVISVILIHIQATQESRSTPLNSKIANYVGKNFEKDKIQKISVVAKEIEFSILQALQGHDIFLRFT